MEPLSEKRLVATGREHCAHCEEMIVPGDFCWRVDVTAEVREHLHAECYPHRDFGSEEVHAHIRGSRSKVGTQEIRKAA